MQIVVGLGNPGKEYEHTRHNAGFLALDYIIKHVGNEGACSASKFKAKIFELIYEGQKHLLVYPETYMNNSGKAVREIMDFYKRSPADILVLHDEVDLPVGTIRFTENSSHAGHNGIKSLVSELGTQEFRRIRIGIESRESRNQIPTDAFVLQNFSEEEVEKIPWEEIKNRTLFELKPKAKI